MNKHLMAAGVSAALCMAKGSRNRSGGGTPAPQSTESGEVNMALLKDIVTATEKGEFLYTAQAHHATMVAAGLVEVNPTMANAAGEFATRSTPAGVAKSKETDGTQPPTGSPPADAPKPSFAIAIVPMPEAKRGGRSGTLYPFDSLQVGQSFFVAATAEKPNPAKSLASTVSSATARYAVEDGTKQVQEKVADASGKLVKVNNPDGMPKMVNATNYKAVRKFEARSVVDGAPWGQPGVKGAGVWRTA